MIGYLTLRRCILLVILLSVRPVVTALFRLFFLLRLGIMLLEKQLLKTDIVQEECVKHIATGSAWFDFCERLKGAGELVIREPEVKGVELTDLDRAEGMRYLSRLIRGGVEAFMDCNDAAYPVLRPLPYNVKLGADNPDNIYLYGTISGSHTYRIHGHRGTVTYLSFACYAGSRPGEGSTTPGVIDSSQLKVQADGSFQIIASCAPPSDECVNWLPMESGTTKLVVRQTMLDRSREAAAQVHIQRLPGTHAASGQQERRPPLSASEVASGLAGSALFINGAAMQFLKWSTMFSKLAFNQLMVLDKDTYMTAWADPAIHFFHGYWSLKPDQALVIEVTPPECAYWNFQLGNWWMESLDSDNFRVHVNKRTAVYRPDEKSVCIVVAHHDPQLEGATYLETAHHSHGTMALRWVLAREHPVPSCRVMSIHEIDGKLK